MTGEGTDAGVERVVVVDPPHREATLAIVTVQHVPLGILVGGGAVAERRVGVPVGGQTARTVPVPGIGAVGADEREDAAGGGQAAASDRVVARVALAPQRKRQRRVSERRAQRTRGLAVAGAHRRYVWRGRWWRRSSTRAPRRDAVVVAARLVELLLMRAGARRTLEHARHVIQTTHRPARGCQRHVAPGGLARHHGGQGAPPAGQRGGKNERQQPAHSPPLHWGATAAAWGRDRAAATSTTTPGRAAPLLELED